MPISISHLRPEDERRSKSFYDGKIVKSKDYDYVEDMLELIICDIVNGLQKSDIMNKLQEQVYEGQRQPYKKKTAEMYYYTALNRMKDDRDANIEVLKDKLFSQYYQLYNDAMETNQTLVAKSVLDSIAKLFVGDTKNVNLKGNIDEKINIDFNFNE